MGRPDHLPRELGADANGCIPELTLAAAYGALEGGHPQRARELAHSALVAAKTSGSMPLEAKCLVCLSPCDAQDIIARIASRGRLRLGIHRPRADVSISIGFSEAIKGNIIESINHRSDKSMYATKIRCFDVTLF